MSMKVKSGLHPKDGYFYVEADGSRVTGTSQKDLIAKVTAYRQRNNFSMGNPQAEVNAAFCLRNPELCWKPGARTPSGGVAEVKPGSLKGRVLSWLMELKRKVDSHDPPRFVSDEEARRRAAICVSCPQNTEVGGGCNTCKATLRGLRDVVLAGKKLADARPGGCMALGVDLPIATMLDEPAVDGHGLPGHCWRRRI